MPHKAKRAELDLGYAGLAILRSFPWGTQRPVVQEMLEKLLVEDWSERDLEIDELDVGSGYRAWAETYDSGPNPLINLEEPVVRSMIDRVVPGVAVDVASGTGRHAAYLLARGHRVIAVDSSKAMIAKARERLPDADLRVGDLYELPVADATADLAVCSLALTHVPELVRPVNELSRIVKKSGHVIVSDVHPLAVATSAHAFFKTLEGSRAVIRNHVHWVSEYISAFNEAKLDIVECVEPKIDAASIETINPPPAVRHWVEEALLGLPFALVWDLAKTS